MLSITTPFIERRLRDSLREKGRRIISTTVPEGWDAPAELIQAAQNDALWELFVQERNEEPWQLEHP